MGNERANAKYLATLPSDYPRPNVDDAAYVSVGTRFSCDWLDD